MTTAQEKTVSAAARSQQPQAVAVADIITALATEYGAQLRRLGDFDTQQLEVLVARMLWNVLAEPGDRLAGRLITAYGAQTALGVALQRLSWKQLCTQYPTLRQLDISPSSFKAGQERWAARIKGSDLTAMFTAMLSSALTAKLQVLIPEADSWPTQLDDLEDCAPLLLWYQGQAAALRQRSLAVVGARSSSEYGITVTEHFTRQAVAAGYMICSGAAFGIDAVAHRTALQTGGVTVAILAGGMSKPYPRAHLQLLAEIVAAGGAVVSEMPPHYAPTRWRFLQRNRLIAALSEAVLVTEASTRSGSINTAGHAAQLGRGLGAVPGNITSFGSQGCHKLLLEYSAELICSTAQLQQLLGFAGADEAAPSGGDRDKSLHLRVLDALPLRGCVTSERVAAKAGISSAECENALAELELLGKVKLVENAAGQSWKLHSGA